MAFSKSSFIFMVSFFVRDILLFRLAKYSFIIFPSSIYCTVYFFVLSSIFPYSIISFVTLFSKLYLFVYFLSVYHPLKFLLSTFGSLIFSPSSTVSSLYVFPSKIYTTFSYISPLLHRIKKILR